MEQENEVYRYSPLPDGYIRLILIKQAADNSISLQCDIIHARLLSLVESRAVTLRYTALSYVWGDVKIRRPVSIGVKRLLISSNLYDALLHLRQKREPCLIWADAICIDQINTEERNHQVHQMRRIYSRAYRTVIYLGNDNGTNTSLSAWNFLERQSEWFRKEYPRRHSELEEAVDLRGGLEDVELEVLARPWFRRVWVLQEVVVSKTVFIQCGLRHIPWEDFCKAVLLTQRVNDRYGLSIEKRQLYEYLVHMFQARCSFRLANHPDHKLPVWQIPLQDTNSRSSHILGMLAHARRLEASDPRDKVYALIGISSGVNLDDSRMAINYSKSAGRLYLDFATSIIDYGKSYDVLSHVDASSRERFVGNAYFQLESPALQPNDESELCTLPSWVPNWRMTRYSERTILSTLVREDKMIDRSRRQTVATNQIGISEGRNLLCVGFIVGVVDSIPLGVTIQRSHEDAFQLLRDTYKDNRRLLHERILMEWKSFASMPEFGTGWDPVIHQSSPHPHHFWWHSTTYEDDIRDAKTLSTRKQKSNKPPHTDERSLLRRICDRTLRNNSITKSITEKLFYLDRNGMPRDNSIESHLIQRSRRTVEWGEVLTYDENHVVVDRTSIVDNRTLAHYRDMTSAGYSGGLILGPPDLVKGDAIVFFERSALTVRGQQSGIPSTT